MNTFMKKVFLPNYTQFTTTQKGFRRIPHLFYLLGRKHLPADRHVMTTFPFRDDKKIVTTFKAIFIKYKARQTNNAPKRREKWLKMAFKMQD